MSPMSPLNLPNFFCLYIYSLWCSSETFVICLTMCLSRLVRGTLTITHMQSWSLTLGQQTPTSHQVDQKGKYAMHYVLWALFLLGLAALTATSVLNARLLKEFAYEVRLRTSPRVVFTPSVSGIVKRAGFVNRINCEDDFVDVRLARLVRHGDYLVLYDAFTARAWRREDICTLTSFVPHVFCDNRETQFSFLQHSSLLDGLKPSARGIVVQIISLVSVAALITETYRVHLCSLKFDMRTLLNVLEFNLRTLSTLSKVSISILSMYLE